MKKTIAFYTIGMLVAVMTLSSCGKSSGGKKVSQPAVDNTKYEALNGNCFNAETKELTDPAKCDIENDDLFVWDGTQCFDTVAGSLVDRAYCTHSQFQMQNGKCWDNLKNAAATSNAYCENFSSNRFVQQNGYCIDKEANMQVPSFYCEASTGNNANQCKGWYYAWTYWGYPQYVLCDGYNCRGMTVYNINSNNGSIRCQ